MACGIPGSLSQMKSPTAVQSTSCQPPLNAFLTRPDGIRIESIRPLRPTKEFSVMGLNLDLRTLDFGVSQRFIAASTSTGSYSFTMGRDAEPVQLSGKDLSEFANALRIVAAMIDADVESMRIRNLDSIKPKLWKTASAASNDLVKFVGAIRTAIASQNFPSIEPNEQEQLSTKSLRS